MNIENITQQGEKLVNQVAGTVEKTGQKIANQVSNITDGKPEEVTKEVIQAAVDQALDVMQIAGDRVREKNINGERVTLEIDVEVVSVARLKITTNVPGKDED
ncbi:hypothetical protein [Pleurocapsa sp. PCC 7319]|uniref:hypothetical protein n=1 Tax=Pleurocapsa sp. PCC 7319 TaxID=118161 RepID=UPI000372E8C5|nr:hypothetical protein [Pleurocapsa sp. PCC 7319]